MVLSSIDQKSNVERLIALPADGSGFLCFRSATWLNKADLMTARGYSYLQQSALRDRSSTEAALNIASVVARKSLIVGTFLGTAAAPFVIGGVVIQRGLVSPETLGDILKLPFVLSIKGAAYATKTSEETVTTALLLSLAVGAVGAVPVLGGVGEAVELVVKPVANTIWNVAGLTLFWAANKVSQSVEGYFEQKDRAATGVEKANLRAAIEDTSTEYGALATDLIKTQLPDAQRSEETLYLLKERSVALRARLAVVERHFQRWGFVDGKMAQAFRALEGAFEAIANAQVILAPPKETFGLKEVFGLNIFGQKPV